MNPDITPFDLHHMFLGSQPILFYAEIVVRTLLIYGYTLVMIRWIGGRGIAQLSMIELVLVIALGSAVGDSMFYPDVSLLAAMTVITMIVLVNKGLDELILRSERAKTLIDGCPVAVVENGRLLQDGMKRRNLGVDEVKAMLRLKDIENLGQVRWAFLESSGSLSVFRFDHPRSGLTLVPPAHVIPFGNHEATQSKLSNGENACCGRCGAIHTFDAETSIACVHCDGHEWVAPSCISEE